MPVRVGYANNGVEVFAGCSISGILADNDCLAGGEGRRGEIHRGTTGARTVSLEDGRLNDDRRGNVIRIVPLQNEWCVAARVDCLGDVESIRIKIMEAAG